MEEGSQYYYLPTTEKQVAELIGVVRGENPCLRWNVLWVPIFCVAVVFLPFWLWPISCHAAVMSVLVINTWAGLVLLYAALQASYTMWVLYQHQALTWKARYPVTNAAARLRHLVVMVSYQEPIELMSRTLASLAAQTCAKDIIAVVAFEAREGDEALTHKEQALRERFGSSFSNLMYTRHPPAVIPWESPGKCSNVNYAFRQIVSQLNEAGELNLDSLTGTSCDADSVFHPRYFEWLGYTFLTSPERDEVVWQAPLFYNFNLDQAPFFVRVTGLLRSFFMQGFLIPQSINVMSIFSFSMSLLLRANFFHPRYHFDDNIYAMSCMAALQKRVPLRRIPYPVISGPTSGASFCENVNEWQKQTTRWTIGACDNFNFFVSSFSRFSFLSGISYAFVFTHYYAFVLGTLCMAGVVGVLFSLLPFVVPSADSWGVCEASSTLSDVFGVPLDWAQAVSGWLMPASFAFQYLIFFIIFVLDAFAVKLLGIKEDISIVRNFLHWLSSWFVLCGYNVVCYLAIWKATTTRGGHFGNHSVKDSLERAQHALRDPTPKQPNRKATLPWNEAINEELLDAGEYSASFRKPSIPVGSPPQRSFHLANDEMTESKSAPLLQHVQEN